MFGDAADVADGPAKAVMSAAAVELQETPWPTPSEPDAVERMASILFRAPLDDAMPRERAVALYAEAAEASGDPVAYIEADLDRTLAAANRLADRANAVADEAASVSREDVFVVEAAIGTLRVHRDMYGASYRRLEQAGHAHARAARAVCDRRFDAAVRTLGSAADALAVRARAERRPASDFEPPRVLVRA